MRELHVVLHRQYKLATGEAKLVWVVCKGVDEACPREKASCGARLGPVCPTVAFQRTEPTLKSNAVDKSALK